jgi:hypothetical protein
MSDKYFISIGVIKSLENSPEVRRVFQDSRNMSDSHFLASTGENSSPYTQDVYVVVIFTNSISKCPTLNSSTLKLLQEADRRP